MFLQMHHNVLQNVLRLFGLYVKFLLVYYVNYFLKYEKQELLSTNKNILIIRNYSEQTIISYYSAGLCLGELLNLELSDIVSQ